MRPPAFLRFAKISKIHYIYTIKNKKVPRITAKDFVHKRYFTVNYSFRASFHCIPALQSESSGQFSEKPLLSLFLCKNIVGILHCNNINVTFSLRSFNQIHRPATIEWRWCGDMQKRGAFLLRTHPATILDCRLRYILMNDFFV